MKNYIIFLLSVLLISCNNTDKNSDLEKTLDVNEIPINSDAEFYDNLFDLIDITDFYQLTNDNENRILRYIKEGVYFKNRYYLKPDKTDGVLYIADEKGKIIKTIEDIGEGPYEYRELTSFSIDEKKEELYLHDFQKQRFLVYDLNGVFIRVVPFGYNFMSFKIYKDNFYLFAAKHSNYIDGKPYNYDVLILDSSHNLLGYALPFDEKKFTSTRLHKNKPFYLRNNNEVYFNDILSDTVYVMNKDSISLKFAFQYQNKTLSKDFKNLPHSEIITELTQKKDKYFNYDVLGNLLGANNDNLIYQYSHNSVPHYCFFSLKSRVFKNYVFPKEYEKDLTYHQIFKSILIEQDKFVSAVYPYTLEMIRNQYLKKYKKEDEFVEKINSILESTAQDGNQVIIKYRIKDL